MRMFKIIISVIIKPLIKSFLTLGQSKFKICLWFCKYAECHLGIVIIKDLNRDVHLYLLLFLLAVVLVLNCISLWVVLGRGDQDGISLGRIFMRQWGLNCCSQPNLLHKVIVETRCGEYLYATLSFLKDS